MQIPQWFFFETFLRMQTFKRFNKIVKKAGTEKSCA
jgi:hypothetical protein